MRQYPDSIFKPIDTVFNTKKSYIDSINVCDVKYNYRVLAIQEGTNRTSQSNTESITPKIDENTSVLLFDNISVVDNDHIELRWSPSTYRYNNGYLITKHPKSMNNIVDSISTADSILTIIDSDNVTPEEFHYYYKLHQVDNCKKVSNTSESVKTIFLSGDNEKSLSRIEWTAYEDWNYPIVKHQVEHIGRSGKKYLGKLEPTTFSYVYDAFYEDIDGYYFYQIYSVNSNGYTSYSNIAYISGDGKIYRPNAFSPNGDGVNDIFKFQTLFITNKFENVVADFDFTIYNRWGQQVFHTNDLQEGWDGFYNGKLVPDGVYQYRARFIDGKKLKYYHSGNIHVLK